MRYRPFSLNVLVATCSRGSGMMRRILPTSVSRRCGFGRAIVRISPDAAVAVSDIHHAPFGIAAPRGRVKHQFAHRMNAVVQLHAHHFACRAFERGVPEVGVGPFDEDRLEGDRAGRRNGGGRLVAERPEFEAGHVVVSGRCDPGSAGLSM